MKTSRFLLRPTGTSGFLSRTFRATRPGDPKSYLLKVGSPDPLAKGFSRKIRSFRRECAAYRLLRPIQGQVTPPCLASVSTPDGSDGFLWLREISPARTGDQIAGLSWRKLAATARSIGTIHARFWESQKLPNFRHLPLHHYNRAHETKTHLRDFQRTCRSFLLPQHQKILPQVRKAVAQALLQSRTRPYTLVHGDLRADNLLFSRGRVFIVDWQISAWGLGAFDLARVIGGSTKRPLTLSEQKKLVSLWHQTLRRGGVRHYTSEEAWQDYRTGVALTLSIPITNGPVLARLSPRGKKIARLMIRRFFRNGQVFDLL